VEEAVRSTGAACLEASRLPLCAPAFAASQGLVGGHACLVHVSGVCVCVCVCLCVYVCVCVCVCVCGFCAVFFVCIFFLYTILECIQEHIINVFCKYKCLNVYVVCTHPGIHVSMYLWMYECMLYGRMYTYMYILKFRPNQSTRYFCDVFKHIAKKKKNIFFTSSYVQVVKRMQNRSFTAASARWRSAVAGRNSQK